MHENTRNGMNQLGAALGKLYAWNNAADIECLQVLICTRLLEDQRGYAELAKVRRDVGMPPDRMTRCLRLLVGNKKSVSFLEGMVGSKQNVALIDITSYSDSPSVKVIGLTPFGLDIVSNIERIISDRDAEIQSLLQEVNESKKTLAIFAKLGFSLAQIEAKSLSSLFPNDVFFERSCVLFNAIVDDLVELPAHELYKLNLPNVQKALYTLVGFSESECVEADRHMGYISYMLKMLRSDEQTRTDA